MVNGQGRIRWQLALEKLENARLDKIPANLTLDYDHKNLFKVFQVSVEDLPPEVQAYYRTLLVFPEDAEIPESVLQLYWEHCRQGDYEPLDALDLLVRRSLLSPAGEESFTLHDLLRDYLAFQADDDTAELHKQLLAAYAAAYPGGWHTIPCEEPFYFHHRWHFHVQAAGEIAQASAVADALIRHQPLLSYRTLLNALRMVDYQLADVAPHLLKVNQHPHVIVVCLKILGSRAKEDARRLLKERQDGYVLAPCLNILGDEAKEDAWRFLKESQAPEVLTACLNILYHEAKEDAQRLLRESRYNDVLTVCLKMLGDEAKEDAQRLLRESQDAMVLAACLNILGDAAKKDARRLLKSGKEEWLLLACIRILGKEAEDVARRLIKTSKSRFVRKACRELLFSQNNSMGNLFPDLARLKKDDPTE